MPRTPHAVSRPLLVAVTYWAALVITTFNALSALAGGIAMLTGVLVMPLAMLDGGPFSSFTWPGIFLLVVVGGTQSVATVLLIWRREAALVWTAIAGAGMIIWIFIETIIIAGGSFLQALYFATGMAQLVLVIALLGVVAWLPRMPLRSGASDPATAV
jgi:hypothetical protein